MSMGQVALRGIFTAAVAQWTHAPELLNNLATSLYSSIVARDSLESH